MKKFLVILFCAITFLYPDIDPDPEDDYIDDGYLQFFSGEDALRWGNASVSGFLVTPEERDVILNYSLRSDLFNNKLRDGWKLEDIPPVEQAGIKALDKILMKFILFEKIFVYRYAKIEVLEKIYGKETVEKIFIGGKFTPQAEEVLKDIRKRQYTDPGFMSTTLIQNAVFSGRPIELQIRVPKYVNGLSIARKGFTFFVPEYEILFLRGRSLSFKGYKISKDRSRLILYAKMKGPLWYVRDSK